MSNFPCIGVYICRCGCGGGNISDVVDVEEARDAALVMKGVTVAEVQDYVCSNVGQGLIRNGIVKNELNRVIVASCSPRMHLETFRRAVKSAGLNPYLFEMVNIREQCSWVHDKKEAATAKAIDLIRGAVERAHHLEPLKGRSMPVKREVLVIGGGIAGIFASIELADKGYRVYLIERSPSIGGHTAQLSKIFPTLESSACILTPKMVYVSQHQNIRIIPNAELFGIGGSPGNYEVMVRIKPRYVNVAKCTACGECAKVCPAKKPSQFEENLLDEKAIYIPFPMAIPNAYMIDKNHCLYFMKGGCRICEQFCEGEAIDFGQEEEIIALKVGAIVVCTGYELLDPRAFGQYGFGLHPDIVTNLQFERLMSQGILRPSNGEIPKKVAFILCVGSRSTLTNGREYCCNIGCMNALKHALMLVKAVPETESWIFYTDIRAHGRGYEEFYATVRGQGAKLMRGLAAEVAPSGSKVLVRSEDTLLRMPIEEAFDLVVLSPALIPSSGTPELARVLGIDLGPDGFFLERHHKLSSVETRRKGIYIAGCAQGPKDIREVTMESMATASKVATFLDEGEVYMSPEVAYIIPEKCNGCGECIEICPTKAIELVHTTFRTKVAINPVSCLGCGICLPKCQRKAIDVKHCTEDQLVAQIKGVCEGDSATPKILAFLEGTTAYGCVDLAGQTRRSYPSNVRIIKVPSTGRLDVRHLLYAFATGADGIVFIEGYNSLLREKQLRSHIARLRKDLHNLGIEPLRLTAILTTLQECDRIVNLFEAFNKQISKMAPLSKERRERILGKIRILRIGS